MLVAKKIFLLVLAFTVFITVKAQKNPYKYVPKDSLDKIVPQAPKNPYKFEPKDTITLYRYDTLNRKVTFEFGPLVGFMNPRTDITEYPQLRTAHLNLGGYFSVQVKRILGIRLELNSSMLQEADTLQRSLTYIKRNMNYRTNILEYSLNAEFYPFNVLVKKYRQGYRPKIQPYLSAGIGRFSFKPETELNGTWHEVRPLSLEGQGFPTQPERKPYKLNEWSYPFGIGFKWDVDDWLALRLEFLYRYTKTDYIDDISTLYIDGSDFYRFLPTLQMADLANILYKRQYLPGNTLSTGERRGRTNRTDGFYTVNLKVGFKFGCLCNK